LGCSGPIIPVGALEKLFEKAGVTYLELRNSLKIVVDGS